eukprot:jgi/Bigna1/146354/aug1.113_g21062
MSITVLIAIILSFTLSRSPIQSLNAVLPSFVLSPGNFTIIATIRDVLGGYISQPAGMVAVAPPAHSTSASGAGENCAAAIHAAANVRTMIESAAVLASGEVPDDDICAELRLTLEKLKLYELHDQALALARNALEEISGIPLDPRATSTCQDQSNELRGGECSSGSLSDLSLGLWTVVEERMNDLVTAVLSQAEMANGEEALVIQVLEAAATSPVFSDASIERADSLSASVQQVISYASPEDLAGDIGQSCAVVLSELLRRGLGVHHSAGRQRSSTGSRRNRNGNGRRGGACALVDDSIRQMDEVLRTSGSVIPPGSNSGPLRYQSFAFQASTSSSFADQKAELSTSSVSVLASPSASSASSVRPRVIVGMNEVQLDVTTCRPLRVDNSSRRGERRRLSPVVSINIYNSSGDSIFTSRNNYSRNSAADGVVDIIFEALTPDGDRCGPVPPEEKALRRSCRFWDTEREIWSTAGCRYISSSTNSSRGICRCRHLTEFALLSDLNGCSQQDSTPQPPLAIFSALVGVYIVLGLVFAVQVLRLLFAGIDVFSIIGGPHVIGLGLCVVRIASLALIAQILPGFGAEAVHIGGVIIVLALPYTFSLALYMTFVFQWISIVHNKRLSKTPFEQVKKCYCWSTVSAIVACWVIFLLFFGYMRRNNNPSAVTIATGALVGLFVVIIVAVYIYGYRLFNTIRSTHAVES